MSMHKSSIVVHPSWKQLELLKKMEKWYFKMHAWKPQTQSISPQEENRVVQNEWQCLLLNIDDYKKELEKIKNIVF
jgi:hypothetical protein